MEFFIENWYIILALGVLLIVLVLLICRFSRLPSEEQLDKVREWLLWAVIEAERALGSGTGQLKLRQVYDLFVTRFGWLAKVIPFGVFSAMVDDALAEMKELLAKNEKLKCYVEGGGGV